MAVNKGLVGFFLVVFLGINSTQVLAAQLIKSVNFVPGAGNDQIMIQGDGPLEFTRQDNAQDRQVVIEVKNAKLSKTASRNLDTSSFDSSVSLVSPYQVEGEETVRIVLSLRDVADVQINAADSSIQVSVPNMSQGSTQAAAAPRGSDAAATSASDTNANSNKAGTNLDTFSDAHDTRQFSGKKITLQVRDAEVGDVLRLIGEASGFNMVISEEVKGTITLSLIDVPWDQALDVVLHTKGLGAERNNNILRVLSLAALTQEKVAELRAKKASEANAPRVTKVFPINYAKPAELQKILTTFGRVDLGAMGSDSSSSSGSSSSDGIQIDERTNSVIVRDIPDNIEKMRKLIEILDTQTPQVMIEAKVIEATEGFSKNMGGSLGFGSAGSGTSPSQFASSFAGGNPIDLLLGNASSSTPARFAAGSDFSNLSASPPSGAFGLSPHLNFIPGINRLNALITMGESESQLKVVSSPKTVVMNKQKTTIIQSTPVLVPTVTMVNNVPVSTPVVQQANLSFTVTPTVTNDGNVILDLNLSRDVPTQVSSSQNGIAARQISTNVVIESGTTLVIGGIYTVRTDSTSGGFPFLRKIPIIGAFFGTESETVDRSELFFFVTPRIINEREAGISG